jgi:hypothetical protein
MNHKTYETESIGPLREAEQSIRDQNEAFDALIEHCHGKPYFVQRFAITLDNALDEIAKKWRTK